MKLFSFALLRIFEGDLVKKIVFLMIAMMSLRSVATTKASGDYYLDGNNDYCWESPVAPLEVNFDLKTFKNSYIDDVFRRFNTTPPANQVFTRDEKCYLVPGAGDRPYCVVATFFSNTEVMVNQYYIDYGHPRGGKTLNYTFSPDLTSLKITYPDSSYYCNYKLSVPRKASKNDLLLKNGALFQRSNKGKGALTDPTGLHWLEVLRKDNSVIAVNHEEAKSYCESKMMRLPTEEEAKILVYYLSGSTPIEVVGTNYQLKELFPDYSKYSYWAGEHIIYSDSTAWFSDNTVRTDPISRAPIGVRCVTR